MNIKHYLSAMAALAMLAACSDYDPGMSENAVDLTDAEIETINEYTANFVQRYGEIDPNHTWGFGVKGSEDEMGTRSVDTGRNNWVYKINETGDVQVVTTVGSWEENSWDDGYHVVYTDKFGWKVPGFPSSVDGTYRTAESDEGKNIVEWNEEDFQNWVNQQQLNQGQDPQPTQVKPIGDVTDEEIEYVSWWFRTNPNPTPTTVQLTEYFIQDISQDYDRESYPNGAQINTSYTNMDYFAVQTSDGIWEHNNNFNRQKANPIAASAPATVEEMRNSSTTYPNRTLKYWQSEGLYYTDVNSSAYAYRTEPNIHTTSFSYHNSDDSKDYQRYVLVHLQFYGPRTGRWYDGYYLAFDYEMHKNTSTSNEGEVTDINADGYYSNWIVKISPANPDFYHNWHRVMCEDLGSTDDYDFNDLVFDVYYTGTGTNEDPYIAHIRIQASGGTLPIHIGYNEDAYETHRLLQGEQVEYNSSTDLYTPINVGFSSVRGEVKANPVDIELNMTELIAGKNLDPEEATNPDRIPIYVNKFTSDERKAFVLPETDRTDAAPQKICIDGNKQSNANQVRWMRERQQIEDTYTYFKYWVNTENSVYDYGKANDWTLHGLMNTSNLY